VTTPRRLVFVFILHRNGMFFKKYIQKKRHAASQTVAESVPTVTEKGTLTGPTRPVFREKVVYVKNPESDAQLEILKGVCVQKDTTISKLKNEITKIQNEKWNVEMTCSDLMKKTASQEQCTLKKTVSDLNKTISLQQEKLDANVKLIHKYKNTSVKSSKELFDLKKKFERLRTKN